MTSGPRLQDLASEGVRLQATLWLPQSPGHRKTRSPLSHLSPLVSLLVTSLRGHQHLSVAPPLCDALVT